MQKLLSALVLAFGALTLVALLWSPPALEIEQDETVVSLGQGECPPGSDAGGLGPSMTRLPEGFCIDNTEVSRAQYSAWLDTTPDTGGQPAACIDNAEFTPACAWDGSEGENNQPVVCVDWCDARAFCEAAGKRLCGAVGTGDAYSFDGYDDPAVSEWQAACTSGGENDYTYGNEHNTDSCRDADAEDHTTWGFEDVGSFSECHSPNPAYAAVLDLSGHAAEWDNACEGDGPEDACRIRGGSFEHNQHGTRCDMARSLRWPRSRTVVSVGFRCCAD